MGIRHSVPAGLPTGTVSGKVAGDDWRADHLHVPFEVPLILSTTNAALTPAAASAAVNTELFATSKVCRTLLDLSQATQARMTAMVIATGNAAGAAWKMSYMTTNAATWAGTDMGPSLVVGANGGGAGVFHDSGWVNLAAGAKIDNCYWTVLVGVAQGTTAPTIGSLQVYFR